MNSRRYAQICSLLALTVVGCGAAPGDSLTGQESSALLTIVPATPNWATGLSSDGVVLGFDTDGTPLIPCRASYDGSETPGKTRRDWNACHISYGGVELFLPTYETLATSWVPESGGLVPAAALSLGYGGYFACRATYAGALRNGKIGNGLRGCDFPYEGQEIQETSYSVLVGSSFAISALPLQTQTIPDVAIRAGYEANGTPIYLCAAVYEGAYNPGKTEPGWNGCDISWGGREILVPGTFSVLVPDTAGGAGFVAGTNPALSAPPVAVEDSLGICQVAYENSKQLGKYLSWTQKCSFAYNGSEIWAYGGEYTVLSAH